MGPQLPTIPDLAQLQFLPPGLNQMAGQQIQTAQQSADQGLALGAQDLQAKQLQNMFDSQNNNTRLLRGKADLEGVNAENIIKNIDAKQRQTLAPEELEVKRSKFVKELSDAKLEKALNDAQQMMMSDDPELAAKGKDLYFRSGKEQSARAKAKDTQDNTRLENEGRANVANIHAGAARYSADKSNDARRYTADARNTDEPLSAAERIANAKTFPAKVNVFEALATEAAMSGDQETAAYWQQQRDSALNQDTNARTASAGVTANGKIDLNKAQQGVIATRDVQPAPVAPAGAMPPIKFTIKPDGSNVGDIRAAINRMPEPARSAAMQQLDKQISGAQAPTPQADKPAAAPTASYADVAKQYPGVPEAKLREAYKKKFGVDLK